MTFRTDLWLMSQPMVTPRCRREPAFTATAEPAKPVVGPDWVMSPLPDEYTPPEPGPLDRLRTIWSEIVRRARDWRPVPIEVTEFLSSGG